MGGGTGAGGGAPNPCDGVVCSTPPARRCLNAQTLATFEPAGVCDQGACRYTERFETCASGCAGDACQGNRCQGVVCNSPPLAQCVNSTTLKRFNAAGGCTDGVCSYAEAQVTCPFGCVGGACTNDPCAGVSCTTPPATFCLDALTQRAFGGTGTCAGGGCTYVTTDTTCPFGCAQGTCRADPCAGVTCTTPPAPACVNNGAASRRYAATGTCGGNGACSYGFSDVPCANGCTAGACNGPSCGGASCNAPPADTCVNAQTLRTAARLGTCSGTTCQYQMTDVRCSSGCLNGACLPGSWRFEPSPMASSLSITQLALEPSGAPHLIGCAAGGVEHRWRDDFGWKSEVIDPGVVTTDGCFASLAIDATGQVMAAWFDGVNDDLRFARRIGGVWQKEIIKSAGDVGRGAIVALDATGSPSVAAVDGSTVSVFRKPGAAWVGETALTSAPGVALSLRYSPQGVLHLVSGRPTSVPVSSGGYNQPSALLAVRGASAWTERLVDEDAMVSARALQFLPDGTPVVVYGVVPSAAQRARVFSQPPIDTQLGLRSNLSSTPAMQLYAGVAGTLTVAMPSTYLLNSLLQRRNRAWVELGSPPPLGTTQSLIDARPRADGQLVYLLDEGVVVSPPPGACQPACSTATCGDDGCGGSCGSCGMGQACSGEGECSAWRVQQMPGSVDRAHQLELGPGGELHAASSSASATMYLRRSAAGQWSAPSRVGTGALHVRAGALGVASDGGVLLASVSVGAGSTVVASPAPDGGWAVTPVASFPSSRGLPVTVAGPGAQRDIISRGANQSWGKPRWIEEASFDGSAWSQRYSLGQTDDLMSDPAAALDAQGNLHVVWATATETGLRYVSVRHAIRTNGTWSAPAVLRSQQSTTWLRTPVLERDVSGALHALVHDGVAWQWARFAQGAWTLEVVPPAVATGLDGSGGFSFAVTPQGQPAVLVYGAEVHTRTGPGVWAVDRLPTGRASTTPGALLIEPSGTMRVFAAEANTPALFTK